MVWERARSTTEGFPLSPLPHDSRVTQREREGEREGNTERERGIEEERKDLSTQLLPSGKERHFYSYMQMRARTKHYLSGFSHKAPLLKLWCVNYSEDIYSCFDFCIMYANTVPSVWGVLTGILKHKLLALAA